MEIIRLHHPYNPEEIPNEDLVMALGFFDGVHKGHQKVILAAKKIAKERGLKLAVMTFNHHPSTVFKKLDPESLRYLTTVSQKEERMRQLGVDYLYEIAFTSAFAHIAPQVFVDEYIVGLHVKVAVAGFDYTYGPKTTANMELLPVYGKERFEVVNIPQEDIEGGKVSSTRIRQMMDEGNMEEVTKLLGYVYETQGVVVHGEARGRTLGFPTANLQIDQGIRLPKAGVYAVEMEVSGKWYPAMGQIGYNMTFGDNREMTVEVYILNFHQDIYGERVSVRWNHYLRGEVKFSGVEGLIQQLQSDEKTTAAYFEEKH